MQPTLARYAWRMLEPIHAAVYFLPEAEAAYAALGAKGRRMGYFGSRSAALGTVGPEVVQATFFNFAPTVVHRAIPAAWEAAPPGAWLGPRLDAMALGLRRAWSDGVIASESLAEAADLAQRAAAAAADSLEGRPLFAAHVALPWPAEPFLRLWHAQTLLREFRGDGHIVALLAEGLDARTALVTHAASGATQAEPLRLFRGWTEDEWEATCARLRDEGVLAPGPQLGLTPDGAAMRQRVEERTDRASLPAYAALGEDGCRRLAALGRPLSLAVKTAGLIPGELAGYLAEE